MTIALGALCLAAGCPSSSSDDATANYDVIPLGSLNGFGFDRSDAVGQGLSVLNNQRQIVGVRKAETAGAPHAPFLFEGGVFWNILPPGLDDSSLTFPQLNEAGEVFFPSIGAQVGVFRSIDNVWTRVYSGASSGNEYLWNTWLSDDGSLYGVHSQDNVSFHDPSVTRVWKAGTWTDLSVIPDLPPVRGTGPFDTDFRGVRGVNRTGTMVMTHITSVGTGGNGLPHQLCWVQNLDGTRVDLLALTADGWGMDPLGINDLGQVAGTMTLGENGFGGFSPFLYKDGDVFKLGTDGGVALAMNHIGDVLYRALQKKTILYRADGSHVDLSSVLAPTTKVYGMNDHGDILYADDTGAFLLAPR